MFRLKFIIPSSASIDLSLVLAVSVRISDGNGVNDTLM